jgi:hypothetical protein
LDISIIREGLNLIVTAKTNKLWLLVASYLALLIAGCSSISVESVPNDFIITQTGVVGCEIGAPLGHFYATFSGVREAKYLISYEAGVEALIEDEKIRTLFFHYHGKESNRFRGKTNKGIGGDSAIRDVIEAYGRPTRIGESVISQYGLSPGSVEKVIEYDDKGISFSFWNDRLATVIVHRVRLQ